jgi:hypothetical protein
MALSEIVSVSIQAGTVNPARRGFGVPLIMAYHTGWAGDEVRSYTTFTGVAADFASTTNVYAAAAALFSQSPRPSKIKVGRLPAPGTGQVTLLDFADHTASTAITGSVISPTGVVTAINVPWNTNTATTLADLDTALTAITDLTATVASPVVTVTGGGTLGRMWSFIFLTAHVREATADWAYNTALDLAVTLDPDFFVVLTDNNSAKNMDKVARWALANDRFALFAPQYTKPSQFVSGEFTAGADFTALQANDSAAFLITEQARTSWVDAAWAGKMLPFDPGSATWAFKTLQGVGGDAWTSTERSTIETAHGNHYAEEAEVGITRPGKAAGGEWIDVVFGLAWLEARLQERLFALLVNNPKIPYTDVGLGQILAEVRAQLKEAEERDVLAPGWTVTGKVVAEQATADRAARILRDVEFSATLAGAIHMINVTGTVSA